MGSGPSRLNQEQLIKELRKARKTGETTLMVESRERIDGLLSELQNDPDFNIYFKWKSTRLTLPSLYIPPMTQGILGSKCGRFVPQYKFKYVLNMS